MWDGRKVERRSFAGSVEPFGLSALQIAQEFRQGRLGFADEDVVGVGHLLGAGRNIRPAADDPFAERLTHFDDAPQRFLLNYHGAGEDHVRPFDVRSFERAHVHVHQPAFPRPGQHG